MLPLTISDLAQLRPFAIEFFRRALREDPEAFDLHFELIMRLLRHPLVRIYFWGWLNDARRLER